MKQWIQKHKFIFIQLIMLGVLLILLIILSLFKLSQDVSEWWTLTFNAFYRGVFAPFNRLIPFSITEITIVLFILALVALIVTSIVLACQKKKKTAAQTALFIPLLLVFAITLYQSTAGIAYSRKPLPLHVYEGEVSKDDALYICQYFVDDFNRISHQLSYDESGEVICPYTFAELNELVMKEYQRIDSTYLIGGSYMSKKMIFPWLYSELHITGMFFSITTESIINYSIPNSEIPFTMLHEIAHSKGVMRENDAQLLAMYLSLTSSNDYIRYSGYMNTIYSMLNLARQIDEQRGIEINNSLTSNIFKESAYNSNYWKQYHILDDISTFFNDLYLYIFSNDNTGSYVDSGSSVGADGTIYYSTYQKLYFGVYFETIYFG